VLPVYYLAKRVGIFFLIVWLAATLNFFLPRIGGENPVAQKVMQMAALGGNLHAGMHDMVVEYEAKFGIDKPLWKQYLIYLRDMTRFDFGYSITAYPRRVSDMILEGLPWTICLITVTTIISFVIGNILGAYQAWPRAPRWLMAVMPPLLMLSAIPFFLLGLILVYVVGFSLQLAPLYGGYTAGSIPQWSFSFALDVAYHAILPATAIILGSLGGWALGMRAMMVTTQGEDYVTFAEAKGLSDRTLFLDYGIRNAILPQATALALSLGQLVSGAVLVEIVFGYPGIGTLLFQGIRGSDFFLVQGIVFLVIVAIGLSTLILDLIYPLLDPRIVHRSA
jgi:peptide/nickel transport system permease protein